MANETYTLKQIVGLCIGIVLCLSSCRSYQFQQNGFVVDGEGVYHSPGKYAGIALFGDFVNFKKKEKEGIRFDKLYPGDKRVLKALGYRSKEVNILFSGMPNQEPYYHVIAVGAKEGVIDTAASIIQNTPTGKYHYRRVEVGKNTVLEAIIPNGKTNYALIYYVPKAASAADFEQLLAKNVRRAGQHNPFLASKTEVDCAIEDQRNVEIRVPQDFIQRESYTLTKVLRKEVVGESLAVYTLNRKEADPRVVFKLCPGNYRILYTDLQHKELWSKEIEVK